MATQFARRVLRVAVAQICQNIGWHSVQSSPLDLLVDILQRYTLELSKTAHKYCNQYGRTEPNLDDLGLAFKELGILIQEMEEYVNNVEPVAFAHKVSPFPLPHSCNLINCKPGPSELLQRPEWIHEHLPAMHPELDDEEGMAMSPNSTTDGGSKKLGFEGSVGIDGDSPPLGSPHHSGKRPLDGYGDGSIAKKPRLHTEEEGRPMREVSCVFMTPSGYITTPCEGKLPDPSRPCTIESPQHVSDSLTDNLEKIGCPYTKKVIKSKDIRTIKKEKEKNRRIKELNQRKDSKRIKLKPSKKEKENKGSITLKTDKMIRSSLSNPIRKSISSSSGQKTKKSLKSSKNQDGKPLKVKNNKMKQKEGKEEKRNKSGAKTKNKLKNSTGSKLVPLIKSPKSPKVPKSPSRAKSPVAAKIPKINKASALPCFKSPSNVIKEEPNISTPLPIPVQIEIEEREKSIPSFGVLDDESRESPEPRLIIDDSAEAQLRQEKECRMAVLDECINAVIQRAMIESEKTAEEDGRAMDQTIDEVIRNSTVKKIEPRDIYDFTDSSNSSPPLSPKNSEINSPIIRNKKEAAKPPESSCIVISNSETPKKGKSKEKLKKKILPKSKPSPALSSPKSNRDVTSAQTLSPTEKKVLTSSTPEKKEMVELSDEPLTVPMSGTKPITSSQCHLPPPSLSQFATSPFISASPHTTNSFYSSPFATIPAQFPSCPAFPTPPLFVPHRPDISSSFFPAPPSPQPLNLAMSGPAKNSQEKKTIQSGKSSRQPDDCSEELNPAKKIKLEEIPDKMKEKKDIKKEKKEKADKREKSKKKGKEKEKLKEKAKPKEKLEKTKSEKKNKARNEKEKDKKKTKEKEEKGTDGEKNLPLKGLSCREIQTNVPNGQKPKDDSSIPKITLKLGGNPTVSGTPKIVIKPMPKTGGSSHSSSPSSPEVEPPPAPPLPPEAPAPLPPEPVPSPQPLPSSSSPVPPLNTASKNHPRTTAKGRSAIAAVGRKSATSPPAVRTVITETLGTFVDESGNKIWICPACKQPDDGSPMIGCDECDDWYHWVCVGIVVPPKEEESWYCTRCIAKRQGANPRRKKKKHRKEK